MKTKEFISDISEPLRLDIFLFEQLKTFSKERLNLSRSQVKRLIELGDVSVDNIKITKAGAIIKNSSNVVVNLESILNDSEQEPYEYELEILHEDEDIIVINKPSGLSVHPGAGNKNKTLLNALVSHFAKHAKNKKQSDFFRQGIRAGIVHRLDKDTTGVLVVAKNKPAHEALAKQFAAHSIGREYIALVLSTPRYLRTIGKESSGIVETNFGRHPINRTMMSVLKEGGKKAITSWELQEKLGFACVVKLRLKTGRTHQIRVHMDYLGSPVIGDNLYGNFSSLPKMLKTKAQEFGRQALHAASLEINHPLTGKKMRFATKIPQDMQKLINSFRNYEN